MLDREGLRKRLDEQSARDDTRRRHWQERKEKRIAGVMGNPVLPALCRICLIGMLAGAFMAFTGDLFSRRGRGVDAALIRRALGSALAMWAVFGAMLAAGCVIQLIRGFDHPWYDAHRLTRRGTLRMPWRKKYRLWLATAIAGGMILLILYGLFSILNG